MLQSGEYVSRNSKSFEQETSSVITFQRVRVGTDIYGVSQDICILNDNVRLTITKNHLIQDGKAVVHVDHDANVDIIKKDGTFVRVGRFRTDDTQTWIFISAEGSDVTDLVNIPDHLRHPMLLESEVAWVANNVAEIYRLALE